MIGGWEPSRHPMVTTVMGGSQVSQGFSPRSAVAWKNRKQRKLRASLGELRLQIRRNSEGKTCCEKHVVKIGANTFIRCGMINHDK